MKRITTTISDEYHQLAKAHKIHWAEALRQGIALMLAERGAVDYNPEWLFTKKISLLQSRLENTAKELEELKEAKE